MEINDIEILSSNELQSFIENNIYEDTTKLILKYSKEKQYNIKAVVEQIECRKKAKKKLPTFARSNLLFEKTALEQSTSEIVAKYKAKNISGKKIIDLTGGLGIDIIYLSENFENAIYCEMNEVLFQIFKFNKNKLNLKNVELKLGNSIETLKEYPDEYFDWIYVDPARRDKTRRSVDLNYCKPNVVENIGLFLRKSSKICIKVSPAFDFTEAQRLFENLEEYIVISVNNECKEVLLIINKCNKDITKKKAVMLSSKTEYELTIKADEVFKKSIVEESLPYFFLPDKAIIKSELTEKVANQFSLKFANSETNYLLGNYAHNFPGMVYKIIESSDFNDKEFKKILKNNNFKFNQVLCKNFGIKTEEFKRKYKIKDGGEVSLFLGRNKFGKQYYWLCLKEY